MCGTTYVNCYQHRDCPKGAVEWELEGCDSRHNDKCPNCNKEIQPFLSIPVEDEEETFRPDDIA